MTRVYLDACCFIYLVEGLPAFRDAVLRRIERVQEQPSSRLLTSRLSRLECRTKPLRDGDAALLATYDAVLSANDLELVEIGEAVLERATLLRARHGFKTPDACTSRRRSSAARTRSSRGMRTCSGAPTRTSSWS